MKVEIKDSLKVGERAFKAPVLIYDSYAELLKDAGSEQAVLDKMNGWLHHHGSAGEVRDLITDIVEEVSGVKPTVTEKKKGDKTVKVQENPFDYVLRVVGAKPELFDKVQGVLDNKARGYEYKDEQGVVQKVGPVRVDASKRPPAQKGPKKLADKWKEVALAFINGEINPATKKPRSLANFNKALSQTGLNEYVPTEGVAKTDPKNVESLGWLCKAYQDAQDAFKNM